MTGATKGQALPELLSNCSAQRTVLTCSISYATLEGAVSRIGRAILECSAKLDGQLGLGTIVDSA